jgi:hypothetical protein
MPSNTIASTSPDFNDSLSLVSYGTNTAPYSLNSEYSNALATIYAQINAQQPYQPVYTTSPAITTPTITTLSTLGGNYIPYPYSYVTDLTNYGTVTLTNPTVYNIYKVHYQLEPDTSLVKLVKELIFAYESTTPPELAILMAADKQSLKYINILNIQDLGNSEIALTSNQKIQEIVL